MRKKAAAHTKSQVKQPKAHADMQEKTMEQKHSRNNTGAKTLQKHYWSKNTPETLTDLNLPPKQKDLSVPLQKKNFSSQDFSKISRKDGRSHCLDCIFAYWTTYWTTCEKNFTSQRSVSCLCCDTSDCIPSQSIATSDLNY